MPTGNLSVTVNHPTLTPLSPVGQWKFDDASGTTASDSSGSGNNGALSGTTIPTWITGQKNGALAFGGAGYVSVPDAVSLRPTTALTISMWVYPTAVGNVGGTTFFLLKGNVGSGSSQSYGFIWGSTNRFGFRVGNTSTFYELDSGTTQTLALNTWSHIAGKYDGTTSTIYLNGSPIQTATPGIGSLNPTVGSNLLIGCSGNPNSPSAFFSGRIDEVYFFTAALPDAEILNFYNLGPPRNGSVIAPFAGQASASLSNHPTVAATAEIRRYNGTTSLSSHPTAVATATASVPPNMGSLSVTITHPTITPLSPVGYWKFDNGSGTTATDSSGNSNNGSLLGTTIPTWITGQKNGALAFGGAGYVSVPDAAILRPTTAITISMWVFPTAVGNVGGTTFFLLKGNVGSGSGQSYGFIWGSTNRFGFRVGNTTTFYELDSGTTQTLALNTWSHIAGKYDGTTSTIYLNGAPIQTATPGIGSMNPTVGSNLLIGCSGNPNSPTAFFSGRIDEVYMFAAALPDAEILNFYNLGPPLNGSLVSAFLGQATASLSNHPTVSAAAEIRRYGATASLSSHPTVVATAEIRRYGAIVSAQSIHPTIAGAASQGFTYYGTASVTAAHARFTDSLVGYWKFDENTGTTLADSSPNNNTGTLFGGGRFGPGYAWVTGKQNSAVQFINVDEGPGYCLVPASPSLVIANKITMACWFYPTASGNNTSSLLFKGNIGSTIGQSYGIIWTSSNTLAVRLGTSSGFSTLNQTVAALSLNTWHHVAAVYDGTAIRLYIDNAAAGSLTVSLATLVPGTTNPLFIGSGASGTTPNSTFPGYIDEVHLYATDLSVADIAHLYNLDAEPRTPTARFSSILTSFGSAYLSTGHTTLVSAGTRTVPTYGGVASLSATHTTVSSSSHYVFGYIGSASLAVVHQIVTSSSIFFTLSHSAAASLTVVHSTISSSAGQVFLYTGNSSLQSVQSVILPNLIGYWPLDETDLSALGDESPYNNNGTYSPLGVTSIPGIKNNAVNFQFGYGRIEDVSLPTPIDRISIACWIYPTAYGDVGNATAIVWKGNITSGNTQSYGILWDSLGHVIFRLGSDVDIFEVSSVFPIQANIWSHICVTYDSQTMRIYINGALDNSQVVAVGTINPTKGFPFYIAASTSDTHAIVKTFLGGVDEVHLYRTCLSQKDIINLFGLASEPSMGSFVFGWYGDASMTTSHSIHTGSGTLFRPPFHGAASVSKHPTIVIAKGGPGPHWQSNTTLIADASMTAASSLVVMDHHGDAMLVSHHTIATTGIYNAFYTSTATLTPKHAKMTSAANNNPPHFYHTTACSVSKHPTIVTTSGHQFHDTNNVSTLILSRHPNLITCNGVFSFDGTIIYTTCRIADRPGELILIYENPTQDLSITDFIDITAIIPSGDQGPCQDQPNFSS